MEVFAEKFDDIKILRFEIPGFDKLSLNKKLLIYYLSEATLAGRDILWDQHGKYNLLLRDVLEAIYLKGKGNEGEDWEHFIVYLKKVWFASGPHHHYSTDKFVPEFSKEAFASWLSELRPGIGKITERHLKPDILSMIEKLIFDKDFLAKRVNTSSEEDLIETSANNFYEDVSQAEAEDYYRRQKENAINKKLSFGLNTKLVKINGKVGEQVYQIGGKYSAALEHICLNLNKALNFTENDRQASVIQLLMDYYKSGDLEWFDKFSIKWVETLSGDVDFINGFIETYGDPMGMKATWEGVVQLVDEEETRKAETIAKNAQWFESNSPTEKRFKKDGIKGISLKAISAVMLGGDCYPASPLGINLPNAEWIREEYGSKSVTLTNISNAHHKASLTSGFTEEFALTTQEVEQEKKYGATADNLHTHLHECIGHGSGKMLPGVTSESLKNYGSVIEEARADLCGLYFIFDPKMVTLGLLPNLDAARSHYNAYIRNGLLTQVTRIKLGEDVQQAHMRNRQLIASWVFEKGKGEVIEKVVENGKTYFKINDYKKLRILFGELLKEIQRIKSEGDFEAAQNIVETYGVKINQELHQEVLERFKKLGVPPFTGFLNPKLTLLKVEDKIVDVEVSYDTAYASQMMKYSGKYGFLKSWEN
ncbi:MULTISPECIES: dipeptidyl-peptidase 3 family protein [unclassified Saccharicrinis]|uniref:dipeptidyl-peptidase 3 family protein n=1 Tax=unclassified Saccharicrinis TaxID=2646859 RepID=UPI003D32E065